MFAVMTLCLEVALVDSVAWIELAQSIALLCCLLLPPSNMQSRLVNHPLQTGGGGGFDHLLLFLTLFAIASFRSALR
jgi:hypothetical protein